MKEEERRISPTILIVPVVAALGLAAVAGLAFARAAPPKEYVCPYCGATFTTQEELDTHILSEHPAVGWVSPTGYIDPTGKWHSEEMAYDDDLATQAGTYGLHYYGEPLELTLDSPIECDRVRINAASYWHFEYLDPNLSVDVYYEGAYHNIWSGVIQGSYYSDSQVVKRWVELEIPAGIKSVSKARIKWNEDLPIVLWEFDFYKVAEVT